MGVISPRIPLIALGAWLYIFGLWMIISPTGILSSYGVAYSKWSDGDKFQTSQIWQLAGFWYLVLAGGLLIAQRAASPELQSFICILTAVWIFILEIFIWVGWSTWKEIGTTDGGQWFNIAIFAIFGVLFVLAASKPQIKMANFTSPLYFGYYIVTPFVLLWWIGAVFLTDKIVEGYGYTSDILGAGAMQMLKAALVYAFGPIWILFLFLITAQYVVADTYYTYIYNRVLSMMWFGAFLSTATGAAAWDALNKKGEYDNVITGVYFNLAVTFVFCLFFYVPIAMMDKDTLKIGEKKEAKAEAEEEPAEKGEVVEPLIAPTIAPLAPLTTSYQTAAPNYQSYTVPAASYAAPQAYAYTPTTTAYAPTAYATAAPAYPTTGTMVYR